MTKEQLIEKVKTYNRLHRELLDICEDYIKRNNIRPDEEFDDFSMSSDRVLLFFKDDEGDPSGYYTQVSYNDLLEK